MTATKITKMRAYCFLSQNGLSSSQVWLVTRCWHGRFFHDRAQLFSTTFVEKIKIDPDGFAQHQL